MNDDGSDPRLLVQGAYEKPFVTADGTVLFTDGYSVAFPTGAVHAYNSGVPSVLMSDFPGAADDVDAGFDGRVVFNNIVEYDKDVLRVGQIGSGVTSTLSLCQGRPHFEADPSTGSPGGYWETTEDQPRDPAVSPAANAVLFTGCTWRRHFEDATIAIESIDFLTVLTPTDGEQWLISGETDWRFNDPSWSPDGTQIVFLYWRGYISKPLQRETYEGIWVSGADGSNPRQVLTLHNEDLVPYLNAFSPRFTGDGRIVFGFSDNVDGSRDGIYAVPAQCAECTMQDATLLRAGGTQPAWTSLHIAPPSPIPPATPPATPTTPTPTTPTQTTRTPTTPTSTTPTSPETQTTPTSPTVTIDPVVTSPAAGAALPAASVSAKAVSKASTLFVDVNPDKGSGFWKFKVQHLTKSGAWGTYKKTYRTKGAKETRTINFRKGTYRVLVLSKYGLQGATSAEVTLRK